MGAILATNDPIYTELGITTPTALEVAVVTAQILIAESAVRRYLKYDPVQRTRTEFYPRGAMSSVSREGVWEANDTTAYLRSISEASVDELQLQHIPVRSITSLYIDYDGRSGTQAGAFGADTLKVEGTDYWPNFDRVDGSGASVCSDGIIRSFGLWPTEPGSVKVVYVAGYTAAEFTNTDGSQVMDASPIWNAVVQEAARYARRVLTMARNDRLGNIPGVITSENLGDYSYTIDPSIGSDMMKYSELHPATIQRLQDFVNLGWILAS